MRLQGAQMGGGVGADVGEAQRVLDARGLTGVAIRPALSFKTRKPRDAGPSTDCNSGSAPQAR